MQETTVKNAFSGGNSNCSLFDEGMMNANIQKKLGNKDMTFHAHDLEVSRFKGNFEGNSSNKAQNYFLEKVTANSSEKNTFNLSSAMSMPT